MSTDRRTNDRRRRVLYTAHYADQGPSTARGRQAAQRLREARNPSEAYGSRVHQRLRGRWFSLVPVKRRSLALVSTALLSVVALLCVAHYAALATETLVNLPDVARPLRLDRSDSFGRWVMGLMLATSAGASLLIYQLRRYRINDYQGHYRIWRWVILIAVVASLEAHCSLVSWLGAVLDAGFGQRVALSGQDWVRLLVTVGGSMFAIRMVAEVRDSRWSAGMLAAAAMFLAVPLLEHWNVMTATTPITRMMVDTAPLIASAAFLLGLGGYLRMLYREVRKIEDTDSIAEKWSQFKPRLAWPKWERHDDLDRIDDQKRERPKRVQKPTRQKQTPAPEIPEAPAQATSEPELTARERRALRREQAQKEAKARAEEKAALAEMQAEQKDSSDREDSPKRSWFGFSKRRDQSTPTDNEDNSRKSSARKDRTGNRNRRDSNQTDSDVATRGGRFARMLKRNQSKPANDVADSKSKQSPDVPEPTSSPEPAEPRKRRGWSLRLRPPVSENQDPSDATAGQSDADASASTTNRGLGGWFSRRRDAAPDDASTESDETPQLAAASTERTESEEWIDPDNIDWNGMSKAERRRVRKQLKRQGRAA
ncbi:MAG: hypothetical protein AAGA03_03135 [Planctomycetota bacterium]